MAETTIIYNGVTIKNVLTDDIDQQVIADSTGMNPIYVRVTVSCTGIIHQVSAGVGPNTIGLPARTYGSDLVSGYNNVIDNLMQPGRAFQMIIGGVFLFDVLPGWVRPGLPTPSETPIRKRDVNHGPIPSVRLLNVISGNTMKVQFKVVMHLPYADVEGQTPGGAISFRFWISEDIDGDDWTTERTYHGTLRVRHMGHNVLTEIRNNFVMPPLVEGFKRKRISLSQRSNGLELDFTIRDKEEWAMPPSPATHWDGYQTLFTPQPGGFLLASDVMVRVRGDKKTPKLALLQTCQKILDTKLHRLDNSQQKQTILRHLSAKDTFAKNEVEMHATIQLVGKDRTLWNLEKGNFCRPLNVGSLTNASQFPTYNKDRMRLVYPTACIKGLFLASLQDPEHVHGFPNENEVAKQLSYGALDCPEIVEEPSSDSYSPNLSPEQLAAAYIVARMWTMTDKRLGTIQLPFGKSSQSSPQTAVLLQMHKPVDQLRVRMEAERLMEWPTLPSIEEYNKLGAKFAPLSAVVVPSAPITSADSRKTLYHSHIDYLFGQDREASAIPAGLLPYRVKSTPNLQEPNVFVIPASVFKNSGIIFE